MRWLWCAIYRVEFELVPPQFTKIGVWKCINQCRQCTPSTRRQATRSSTKGDEGSRERIGRQEELLGNQAAEGMTNEMWWIASIKAPLSFFDDGLDIPSKREKVVVLRVIRSPGLVLADLVEGHHPKSGPVQRLRHRDEVLFTSRESGNEERPSFSVRHSGVHDGPGGVLAPPRLDGCIGGQAHVRWGAHNHVLRTSPTSLFTQAARSRILIREGLVFRDRAEAGRKLAEALSGRVTPDTIVAGLPRGGLPIAREIQRHLGGRLTSLTVRKLGVPGNEEFAFGAIAPGSIQVLDAATIEHLGLTQTDIDRVVQREEGELQRRSALFAHLSPPEYVGRPVVIVDDGIATGATAHAAVLAALAMQAAQVIVATPVAAPESVRALRELGADVVALAVPTYFGSVGAHYEHFPQVTDEEVVSILAGQ
jgi:putative phosphoribosyl transferase